MTSSILKFQHSRIILYIIFALFAGSATQAAEKTQEPITILFLGDSLTAGYGLAPEQAYPVLVGELANEAVERPVEVINGGVSGDTTAGGVRRVKWVMRRPVDVLVLALGGNDGLRGVSVEASKANLAKIIESARKLQPGVTIVLAGMQMPPNMGERYTSSFRAMYPELAKEQEVTLIPFLLEGVGGVESMNLPDGIHPNADGQAQVAKVVWKVLEPIVTNLDTPDNPDDEP